MSMKWKILTNTFWILLLSTLHTHCSIQGHRHHHGIRARCPRCPSGYGVISKDLLAEENNNGSCIPCPVDTYSSYMAYCSMCLPCSRCGEGLYIAHPCLPHRDTICDSCHTYQGPHNDNYILRCVNSSRNKSDHNSLLVAGQILHLSQDAESYSSSSSSVNPPSSQHPTDSGSVPFAFELSTTPNVERHSTNIDFNQYNLSWALTNSNISYSSSNPPDWNRSDFHNDIEFDHRGLYSFESKDNQTLNSSFTASSNDKVLTDGSYNNSNVLYQHGIYQHTLDPGNIQCPEKDCIHNSQMRPLLLLAQLSITFFLALLFLVVLTIIYAVCCSKNDYGYKVVATIEDI